MKTKQINEKKLRLKKEKINLSKSLSSILECSENGDGAFLSLSELRKEATRVNNKSNNNIFDLC